jgi:hypothetical protein
MAVNKPIGDNARKGAVKKRTQLKNPLKTSTKRNKKGEPVHGGEKDCQEVQGRSAGELTGKLFLALVAVGITVLLD